jgi:uncharacterized membrane protein
MNDAHIHLIVNHVPILLSFFSFLVLAWGWWRKNDSYINLSLVGFVVAAVFAYIASQSGHGAEEIVEDISGIGHDIIEPHEESAELSLWLAIAQGLFAIVVAWLKQKKSALTNYLIPVLLVFSLVVSGNFFYTGYTGGHIRHTEIRPDNQTQAIQNSAQSENEEHEYEDDD